MRTHQSSTLCVRPCVCVCVCVTFCCCHRAFGSREQVNVQSILFETRSSPTQRNKKHISSSSTLQQFPYHFFCTVWRTFFYLAHVHRSAEIFIAMVLCDTYDIHMPPSPHSMPDFLFLFCFVILLMPFSICLTTSASRWHFAFCFSIDDAISCGFFPPLFAFSIVPLLFCVSWFCFVVQPVHRRTGAVR